MNQILNRLKVWGCDIDGAMERFMEDNELYISCLHSVMADESFEKLGQALSAQNAENAFDCAHSLKGVLANMGLTPLHDVVVKIVEPLRNGEFYDFSSDYNKLLALKKQFEQIIT